MMTNAPLSRTLARRGSLLCESGPIYVVSFYLITIHNSLIFIETPSLEGWPTKVKEDPAPREMRLSPTGHQLSISWSWGNNNNNNNNNINNNNNNNGNNNNDNNNNYY